MFMGVVLIAGLCLRFIRLIDPHEGPDPVRVVCPMRVDIGVVLNGDTATAQVMIENVSDSPVAIGRFKPGCSCMAVYQNDRGVKVAVSDLRLAPGEKAIVLLDVRASGIAGILNSTTLEFQELPSSTMHFVVVTYTPVARLYAIPHDLSFGNLIPGQRIHQRIELRTHGHEPRGAPKFTSTDPVLLKYEWLQASVESRLEFAQKHPNEHLLGHLDLVLEAPSEPRSVSESIRIELSDGPNITLNAVAEILEQVALFPGVVVLPIQTAHGQKMTAQVECRSRDGQPIRVESVVSDFSPISGIILPQSNGDSGLIELRYQGQTRRSGTERRILKVVVEHVGVRKTLDLPVTILPELPSTNTR
ncbi:MAG: hypothetical protein SFX72_13215 [Isosphaeraceae bacterium]|nr:hypothetical protein [Isosphaeraceae bacterium]